MARKKPGPKPQRRNPSPLPDEEDDMPLLDGRGGVDFRRVRIPRAEETASITFEQIDTAERALRRNFKARHRELTRRSGETVSSATLRIAQLVQDVAEDNLEHLDWTGRRREDT